MSKNAKKEKKKEKKTPPQSKMISNHVVLCF